MSPLKAKHELQSSSSKILEEKTRKSTPTFTEKRRKAPALAVGSVNGCLNANLYFLVDLYGVNKATSEKALALMKAKLDEIDDKIEKIKQKPKSKEDHFNVDK